MSPEKPAEWQGKTQGGQLGQKSLFWLFRFVDVRLGYLILTLVIPFYMIFSRKGFNAIYWYARNILNKGRIASLGLVYRNHFIFGQVLLDRFSVFAGRKSSFRVEIEGNEAFLERLSEPSGGVIVSAHVGNFELAGYLMKQDKKRLRPIVFKHEAEVYRELRARNLSGMNVEPIEIEENLEHIFKIYTALNAGEYVSMPGDRYLGGMKNMETVFLGRKTLFPVRAFHLAATFNTPVFAIFVMKKRWNTYKIYVHMLKSGIDPEISKEGYVRQLLENYISVFSGIVRKYPAQWFNFFPFWSLKS